LAGGYSRRARPVNRAGGAPHSPPACLIGRTYFRRETTPQILDSNPLQESIRAWTECLRTIGAYGEPRQVLDSTRLLQMNGTLIWLEERNHVSIRVPGERTEPS
jgi:hypothetical protein